MITALPRFKLCGPHVSVFICFETSLATRNDLGSCIGYLKEATTQMWIHVSWFRTRQTLLPKCTSCYRVLCIRGLAVCLTGFGCALIVHSSGMPCGMQPRTSLYHVPPLRSRWMSPHGWRQGLCWLCGCAKEAVLESCSVKNFLLMGIDALT